MYQPLPDSQWSPAFPALAGSPYGAPVPPQEGQRYRLLFADRWRGGGFYNYACYTVEAVSPSHVTLRGYGASLPRPDLTFYPSTF